MRRAPAGGAAVLAILVAVALLSPLLATSLPLLAREPGGRWTSPALSSWTAVVTGRPAPAPAAAGERVPAPVPWDPNRTDLRSRLEPPSREHWLGTDELGRDVLARMIHGSRVSLLVGFASAAASLLLGVVLGALAGYFGGAVDWVILRAIEVTVAFPFLLFVLAVAALFGPSVSAIVLSIALLSWTTEARLVRGEILRLRRLAWMEAARASGAGDVRILVRHLLPAAIAPALVTAAYGVSIAILLESALSFLGFGVPLPLASWGSILSSADEHLAQAWWLAVFPGLAIALAAAAANLLGEGLRVRLDPRRGSVPR